MTIADGVITMTYRGVDGANPGLGPTGTPNVQLTLTPVANTTDGKLAWTCVVTDSAWNKYVPSECRA